MFGFIDFANVGAEISSEHIERVEIEFNISFPKVLKDYYLQNNGAEIKECSFEKDGLEFCVVLIFAISYGTSSLEKMLSYTTRNSAIPKTFVPLALDEDDDYYFWDKKDGKVYFLSLENVEHPKELFGSVEEFFETLNMC